MPRAKRCVRAAKERMKKLREAATRKRELIKQGLWVEPPPKPAAAAAAIKKSKKKWNPKMGPRPPTFHLTDLPSSIGVPVQFPCSSAPDEYETYGVDRSSVAQASKCLICCRDYLRYQVSDPTVVVAKFLKSKTGKEYATGLVQLLLKDMAPFVKKKFLELIQSADYCTNCHSEIREIYFILQQLQSLSQLIWVKKTTLGNKLETNSFQFDDGGGSEESQTVVLRKEIIHHLKSEEDAGIPYAELSIQRRQELSEENMRYKFPLIRMSKVDEKLETLNENLFRVKVEYAEDGGDGGFNENHDDFVYLSNHMASNGNLAEESEPPKDRFHSDSNNDNSSGGDDDDDDWFDNNGTAADEDEPGPAPQRPRARARGSEQFNQSQISQPGAGAGVFLLNRRQATTEELVSKSLRKNEQVLVLKHVDKPVSSGAAGKAVPEPNEAEAARRRQSRQPSQLGQLLTKLVHEQNIAAASTAVGLPPPQNKTQLPYQYFCKICGKRYADIASIRAHVRKEHPPPQSTTTGSNTNDRPLSASYNQRPPADTGTGKPKDFSSLPRLNCPKCNRLTRDLVHHDLLCHQKSFTCDLCPPAASAAAAALDSSTPTPATATAAPTPTTATTTFTNYTDYNYHRTVAHPELKLPNVKCEQCGSIQSSASALKGHIYKIHRKRLPETPPQIFQCDQCPHTTTRIHSLKSHILYVHTEEKPFVCPHCDVGFKVARHLRTHVAKHENKLEKKAKCSLCPKAFYSNGKLKAHMQARHSTGEPKHFCEHCGKGFRVYNYLYIHLRSHETAEQKEARKVKAQEAAEARRLANKPFLIAKGRPYEEKSTAATNSSANAGGGGGGNSFDGGTSSGVEDPAATGAFSASAAPYGAGGSIEHDLAMLLN